jgi:succinyl-CoA synthetase beta subunit
MRENGHVKKYELNSKGITAFLMHRMANRMKLSSRLAVILTAIIRQMYVIFDTYKARAIELTPLVLTKDGHLVILDGRIVFDGDALFAYPDISALKEIDTGTEREHSARQNNFKYTKLGGNIACIVNGTGLGMATVDLIADKGGAVSCLLDIGTEPSKEVVAKAFRMVLGEPDIEGVLVNIFGGITRCDVIAQGLISASHEISVGMPLVVRMDGTNAAVGCRLLQESHLPFELTEQMDVAVEKIVARVEEVA